ncbi:MAG: type III-B CRISPR module-associated protein Cmr3 [Ktedonobacteraceae bacterium]
MMRLFIEPTEALLFRTGRPFDAGNDVFAESVFPPTAETIQGAVRAAIASYWDSTRRLDEVFKLPSFTKLIGDSSNYGHFRITSFSLGRRKSNEAIERIFPAPAHLLQLKDRRGNRLQLKLKPQNLTGVKSNLPDDLDHYLLYDREIQDKDSKLEPLCRWVTESGLLKALRNIDDLTRDEMVRDDKIYRQESRLGIGMENKTKTTREGYLYQVQMVRMEPDYGFVVDIRLSESPEGGRALKPLHETLLDDAKTREELHLPQAGKGWLTLGGEQRAARFEVVPSLSSTQRNDLEQVKTGKLLYLATPAYFEGGWRPGEWLASLPKLIAAAIPRFQPIGGWKLDPESSGGHSKVMRRCVPAGSVYFFDQPVTVTRPLTDYGWQIGYGITVIGEW